MKRFVWISLLLVGLLPTGGQAQTDTTPTLSIAEQLKILQLRFDAQTRDLEAAAAQGNACKAELGSLRVQVRTMQLGDSEKKLRDEVEKAHPGFTLDERGELVAKPEGAPTP